MVKLFVVLAGLAASTVQAAPLERRIAQTISAATQKWEQACIAAGGGQACNPVSVTAFSNLLAGAGPCAQQDSGDAMIDLAKQLGNDAEMIRLTQIFVQQPRNTPNSIATPYCQQAPKNSELDGLFQCQFEGADQENFAGGISLGAAGTIPFGLNAPLEPLGSCPANPDGPIADGSQLVDQVESPGSGAPASDPPAEDDPAEEPPAGEDTAGDVPEDGTEDEGNTGAGNGVPTVTVTVTVKATATGATSTATATPTPTATTPAQTGGAGGFKLANGQAAQALNAEFAGLSADSPCEAGQNACVDGGFAQCVGGSFAITQCAGGSSCFALPLVNAPGTSITCALESDAEARIAASGATGGITGNGGDAGEDAPTPEVEEEEIPAPEAEEEEAPATEDDTATPAPTGGAGGFKQANGEAAQALNAEFAGLTADSPCEAGQNACVDGGFAQCVGGNFVVTQCAGGLSCFALPLVNAPGTSITCSSESDAAARIAASGATGGVTGA